MKSSSVGKKSIRSCVCKNLKNHNDMRATRVYLCAHEIEQGDEMLAAVPPDAPAVQDRAGPQVAFQRYPAFAENALRRPRRAQRSRRGVKVAGGAGSVLFHASFGHLCSGNGAAWGVGDTYEFEASLSVKTSV